MNNKLRECLEYQKRKKFNFQLYQKMLLKKMYSKNADQIIFFQMNKKFRKCLGS